MTLLMERLTTVWRVWKVSEERLEMDAGVACFLSGEAGRQLGWHPPWAGLVGGRCLAWWVWMAPLLVGWVSVSLLAAMGSGVSVAAGSLPRRVGSVVGRDHLQRRRYLV